MLDIVILSVAERSQWWVFLKFRPCGEIQLRYLLSLQWPGDPTTYSSSNTSIEILSPIILPWSDQIFLEVLVCWCPILYAIWSIRIHCRHRCQIVFRAGLVVCRRRWLWHTLGYERCSMIESDGHRNYAQRDLTRGRACRASSWNYAQHNVRAWRSLIFHNDHILHHGVDQLGFGTDAQLWHHRRVAIFH